MILAIDNHKTNNFNTSTKIVTIQKIDYDKYNNELNEFLTQSNITTFGDLIAGVHSIKKHNTKTEIIIKKINPDKPWISERMFDLFDERKRYYLLKKKSPTNAYLIRKYNEVCECINKERRYARANYNSTAINKNINNPKKLWKKLNEIIYNKKNESKPVPSLTQNGGNITTDRTAIANTLNHCFKDAESSL